MLLESLTRLAASPHPPGGAMPPTACARQESSGPRSPARAGARDPRGPGTRESPFRTQRSAARRGPLRG